MRPSAIGCYAVDRRVRQSECTIVQGGLSVENFLEKSRDDRRPEDLGIWKGEGFASLYLDDALTRALESSEEHLLQILTFLGI